MSNIFRTQITISTADTDCTGCLSPAGILRLAQAVSGAHCDQLGHTRAALEEKRLFWAVIRNRITIQSLPKAGDEILLETWPMPTTRTAYPRAVAAYDGEGRLLFACNSLWILMNMDSRQMVLPGKSGVQVQGITREFTPAGPTSLSPCQYHHQAQRQVSAEDIDQNRHMNNGRYLAWVTALLPPNARLRDVKLCYLSEATEGQTLTLGWEIGPENQLSVDICREDSAGESHRVFSAQLIFDTGVL